MISANMVLFKSVTPLYQYQLIRQVRETLILLEDYSRVPGGHGKKKFPSLLYQQLLVLME